MLKKYISTVVFSCCIGFPVQIPAQTVSEKDNDKQEKTAFQTASPWMPEIDIRSDVAIVYGVNGNPSDKGHRSAFEDRVRSWRKKGYDTHFMTGIAWGAYEDYFLGKWDGQSHFDEGQVEVSGDTIWHGHNVPYIVPQKSFINYIKEQVIERVIDAGITSVYLEEPEFWTRGGYSTAFKEEWKDFYGFDWKPQHESAENTWLSNKLKYHLYFKTIDEVSKYAKKYGRKKGLDVKVYIPTHSLVNYSSWMIVSPEASLASLPGIDGYIAQVWTGTSREATYFNGVVKERTFENAFLEYGSMVSMTAPTNRKIFFLTDPIEDRRKDWDDYKKNYEATFTAQLLYPRVNNYEVMPWPERIYTKPYKVAYTDREVLIPYKYSTQMQVMINALNDMPVSGNKVSGINSIGVLMGNSMMFQRLPTHEGFEDPRFSNFYGQTLPLLKRGIPVQTVHMENLGYKETLQNIKVLVMSYSNMKPHSEDVHENLEKWVKNGGMLIYTGRDDDPYQNVTEWWNGKKNRFDTPSGNLFKHLGIPEQAGEGRYKTGKGEVFVIRKNPKEFVMEHGGDENFVETVKHAFENDGQKLLFKNNLALQRGPYRIIAVMDESVNSEPYFADGPVVDLFNPLLPVLTEKTVVPGEQAFLYSLNYAYDKNKPAVVASAARISNEKLIGGEYSFTCKSPVNTMNSLRVFLPSKPEKVMLEDSGGTGISPIGASWDNNSRTYYLQFANKPEGIQVKFKL
ncbi:hypothetical protein ED312_05345 [Sinomicrobium pectinilyticum]|uniref:Uncharacterized protein n=1 Tax=Sinomicrobium pectinilyticum TaxID=1084421 RepID=A0A3N0ET81_SINP1|nr:hypothetical protein [Sinomicrobium pectinilyticum]RNL91093.1 hypothetical protein ED312_05345 [Sinomicrobium pectinilyticum]